MNLGSLLSYIAACALANLIAFGNSCATILSPIAGAVLVVKKGRSYVMFLSCIGMIVILSVFSWLAFKEVIKSFVDVENQGLATIPEAIQAPVEGLKNFMILILSHLVDISAVLIIAAILLKKIVLAFKIFIFSIISSVIVVIFLSGRIFSIIASVL